ncbi:winged helix-turn-helix domain-containing protein [Aeromonas sp. NJAU223]|uniref:winged helix-turn-helix domain-containing protein n=1 Tax=Aeromonas sp. NJAU223 TaxID=3115650 RepID=UPI003DA92512
MTEPSKTRTSFYRRLYVAYLISQGTDTVPAIMAATGMPRRTAQDTLTALAELDILCLFEQTEGARHLQGHYRISDWGPINPAWIAAQLVTIKGTLGYP